MIIKFTELAIRSQIDKMSTKQIQVNVLLKYLSTFHYGKIKFGFLPSINLIVLVLSCLHYVNINTIGDVIQWKFHLMDFSRGKIVLVMILLIFIKWSMHIVSEKIFSFSS